MWVKCNRPIQYICFLWHWLLKRDLVAWKWSTVVSIEYCPKHKNLQDLSQQWCHLHRRSQLDLRLWLTKMLLQLFQFVVNGRRYRCDTVLQHSVWLCYCLIFILFTTLSVSTDVPHVCFFKLAFCPRAWSNLHDQKWTNTKNIYKHNIHIHNISSVAWFSQLSIWIKETKHINTT